MEMKNLVFGAFVAAVLAVPSCGSKKWDPKSLDLEMPKVPKVEIVEGLPIEGLWMGPRHADGGMVISSIYDIKQGALEITSFCGRDGIAVTVKGTAPVRLTENSIEVLEAGTHVEEGKGENGNSVTCEILFEKTRYEYEIIDGKLYFVLNGEKALIGETQVIDHSRIEVR